MVIIIIKSKIETVAISCKTRDLHFINFTLSRLAVGLRKGDHPSSPDLTKPIPSQTKTTPLYLLDGVECSSLDAGDEVVVGNGEICGQVLNDWSDPPTDTELEKDIVLKNVLLPSRVGSTK